MNIKESVHFHISNARYSHLILPGPVASTKVLYTFGTSINWAVHINSPDPSQEFGSHKRSLRSKKKEKNLEMHWWVTTPFM